VVHTPTTRKTQVSVRTKVDLKLLSAAPKKALLSSAFFMPVSCKLETRIRKSSKAAADKVDVGDRQNRRVGVIFGWHANNHPQSKETPTWIDGIFFKAQF
jgi:hypothetical protein